MERDRSCPVTGALPPSSECGYDWEKDALGCWHEAVEEAKQRKLAGKPMKFFEDQPSDKDRQ